MGAGAGPRSGRSPAALDHSGEAGSASTPQAAGRRGLAHFDRHLGILHLTRDADEVADSQPPRRRIPVARGAGRTAELLQLADRQIGFQPIPDALRLRRLKAIAFQRCRDPGGWIDTAGDGKGCDAGKGKGSRPHYRRIEHDEEVSIEDPHDGPAFPTAVQLTATTATGRLPSRPFASRATIGTPAMNAPTNGTGRRARLSLHAQAAK